MTTAQNFRDEVRVTSHGDNSGLVEQFLSIKPPVGMS